MPKIKIGDEVVYEYEPNKFIDATCIAIRGNNEYLVGWKNYRSYVNSWEIDTAWMYYEEITDRAIAQGYRYAWWVWEDSVKVKTNGIVYCKNINEYAVVNQVDGSFICYSCR